MHSRKTVCSAFRIHGAHILPMPARFGYMATISCQGGALFPSEAPSGMHGAKKLPQIAARECIASIFCHGKALGNAQRRHIATTRRPELISRASCHRRTAESASRAHVAMTPVSGQHIADMSCHAWPLRTNRACISPAKPPFSCARVQDARFCHVSPELIRGMRRCPAAAMRAAAMGESGRGRHWGGGPPGAGRHWRARSVGAELCHGTRDRRPRATPATGPTAPRGH